MVSLNNAPHFGVRGTGRDISRNYRKIQNNAAKNANLQPNSGTDKKTNKKAAPADTFTITEEAVHHKVKTLQKRPSNKNLSLTALSQKALNLLRNPAKREDVTPLTHMEIDEI